MIKLIALLQGNKKHTSAYSVLVIMAMAGIGTSVDLLLELGELRATEKYQEMTITRLVDQLFACEDDRI